MAQVVLLRRLRCVATLLTACTLPGLALAQPPLELPPAARPGGIAPFLTEPPGAEADAFAIPPLIERPLGLDEGPTVRVSRFRLDGAVDRPEHGIRLDELEALLARELAAQPAAGYTVNRLQAVADAVTQHYRNRGLFLAQAFVPAQDVIDGTVTLQVMEGTLGGVEVDGNALYDAALMRRPFAALVGGPVSEAGIEQALLTLQDFPGLTVFGTFREGAGLGETELLVQVREEDRVTVKPLLDNYGSRYTGQGRAALQLEINNPFGAADRVNAYVLKTFDPSNGVYGGVEYTRKVGRTARTALSFGAARNAFDVTDTSLGVDLGLRGIVEQVDVSLRRTYARRRTLRSEGTFALTHKDAVTKQPGADPTDELLDLSYTYDFFTVGDSRRGLNLGSVRVTVGDNGSDSPGRRGSSGATAEGTYAKLEASYQRLMRLGAHQSLLLKAKGQASDDLLASLEQFAIGGPANVRAYPVSEALVDTGGALTLEWTVDAPGFADRPLGTTTWGNVLEVSFYIDYAGGKVNDPFPHEPARVNLRGYGIGIAATLGERVALRLDVAKPDTAAEPSNGRDPQTYLGIAMTF